MCVLLIGMDIVESHSVNLVSLKLLLLIRCAILNYL